MILLIGISLSRLVYPYDVGYFEACVWEPALLAASGMNPYDHSLQPPFVMAPYGYFYYLVIGLGLKIFGLQLWFGRLVSALAAGMIVISIWRISMSLTGTRRAALLAIIVFLSSITLQSWIAVQRPDLPGLALAFAGLALVVGNGDRQDKINLYTCLIAVLFAGAFFFKQTFILPPLVAFAWYLLAGRRKQAIFVPATMISLCGFISAALNVNSAGGHLWQHFKLTREIPYSYLSAVQMLAGLLKSPGYWVLSVIPALFVFDHYSGRGNNGSRFSSGSWRASLSESLQKSPGPASLLLCIYFIAAVSIAFVTSSRTGANINYYLEPGIVLSIIVSIAWARLSQNKRLNKFFLPVLVLLMVAGVFQLVRAARGEYYRWQSLPYYRETVSTLNRMTQPGSVSISVYPELVVAAQREYHFGDWIQYVDGRSPELQKSFQEAVESNSYSAIIWFEKDAQNLFPGYSLKLINRPIPARYYPVYLYVRSADSPHQ